MTTIPILRPIGVGSLLVKFLMILACGETIGLFGIRGFVLVDPPATPSITRRIGFDSQGGAQCPERRHQRCTALTLELGQYSVDLERPLGMILEERGEGGDNCGVQVQEILKDESAGSAWTSGRIAPREVVLEIDGTDVSNSDFDSVMDILTSPSDEPTVSLVLGDGLGNFDMPKNVLNQLKTTEDAFYVDAVVREAVRAIRRDGRLGDLLNVEVIVGAGVTTDTDNDLLRGMVRFFGIFSTDGVTTYSCNVSATGVRKIGSSDSGNEADPNRDVRIISLSCAKDEGLGRTYDLIQENQDKAVP